MEKILVRGAILSRNKAKTLLLNWYDSVQFDVLGRRRFLKNVDRFFEEIRSRESDIVCRTTVLQDETRIKYSMSGKLWRSYPVTTGYAVSSLLPDWRHGWRNVFDNEDDYEFFSWLAHYSDQYIHRSYICKVLMAIWERDGVFLHPFGKALFFQRNDRWDNMDCPQSILRSFVLMQERRLGRSDKKGRCRSKWILRNTFEPSVHQGISHFLRAQELLRSDFRLEALVAFDCVLQSIQQLNWQTTDGNPKRDRRDLCRVLGIGVKRQSISEEMYYFRNQFGAHAGGWRWWDFEELFQDELCSEASGLANGVLCKAAELEHIHTLKEPEFRKWSEWYENNFEYIWGAVWYK